MPPDDAPEDDPRFRSDEPRIHPSAELKGTRLGRFCEIGPRVVLRDVTVGDFTYFERGGEAIHAALGRFCSVAANVRINALAHPTERVTTHKITYRANEYFRFRPLDAAWRGERAAQRVAVGHDVWIGHGAVILPGVAVGTGAVIGANAVVTRNVAPYEVVAGVPARRLRFRFDETLRARLLALAWWDWPRERLFEAVEDMARLGAEDFCALWEARLTLDGGTLPAP